MDSDLADQLWDAAPAIALVLDRQGRVLRANPYLDRVTGFSDSEVVGFDWTAVLAERCREQARADFEETLKGNSVIGATHCVRTRDGDERTVEWHQRLLAFGPAREETVLAVGFDVTQRVAAETALRNREHELRRSREQLNEAQRIAKIGSWELDLRNDELEWSDEIFRIFEIDSARFEASYEAFLDAVHPDDRQLVDVAYTNSVKNRVPYAIVHRLRFPDGRIKWVHEHGETRFDEAGDPLCSAGTVQDITEQVVTQRELEESQRAYRRLHQASRLRGDAMDASLNAIAVGDLDGTLRYANPAFVRMWGYTDADEILGRSVLGFAADPAEAARAMDQVLNGEPFSAEMGARRKDGQEFTVMLYVSMLPG